MNTWKVIFTGLKGSTMSPFIHEVRVIVHESESHLEVIREVLKDLGYNNVNILTVTLETEKVE